MRIGIVGGGRLAERLRHRIAQSRLEFRIADDADDGAGAEVADVIVRVAPAPEPNYLGVASADHPGELYLTDERAIDHIIAVLEQLAVSGAATMRVRRPIASEWTAIASERLLRKRLRHFDPDHYDWIGAESVEEDVFDGELVLHDDAEEIRAHAKLMGYLDPNDGHYHWAGTVFGPEVRSWKENRVTRVTVSVADGNPVDARLAEITPSGAVRVVGVGVPPYSLAALVV